MDEQDNTIIILKSLLNCHKKGLLLKDLEKEYKEQEGEPYIPYRKYGYNNLVTFLRSKPDDIKVEELENGDVIVSSIPGKADSHVVKLVVHQKTATSSKRTNGKIQDARRHANFQKEKILRSVPTPIIENIARLLFEHPQGLEISKFEQLYRTRYGNPIRAKDFGFETTLEMAASLFSVVLIKREVGSDKRVLLLSETFRKENASKFGIEKKNVLDDSLTDEDGDGLSLLPAKIKKNLTSLISKSPEGIPVQDLIERYEREYSERLDFRMYHLQSVLHLCTELGGAIEILDGKEKIVRSRRKNPKTTISDKSACIKQHQSRVTSKLSVSEILELTQKLKLILAANPNGLTTRDLADKLTVSSLDFDRKKFEAADKETLFRCALSDSASFERLSSGLIIKLRSDQRINEIKKRSIYSENFFIGESIQPQELPQSSKRDALIPIMVHDGDSIDNFYFHVKGPNIKELEELSNKLDYFYDEATTTQNYAVRSQDIYLSMICVAPFCDDRWYRVQIKKILCMAEVELFYLDYGSKYTVSADKLRFLHRNFSRFPAQALNGRLAGIRPPKNSLCYSQASTDHLGSYKETPLYAQICGKQSFKGRERFSLYVFKNLEDAGSQNLSVNIEIVREGFAEIDPLAITNNFLQEGDERPHVNGQMTNGVDPSKKIEPSVSRQPHKASPKQLQTPSRSSSKTLSSKQLMRQIQLTSNGLTAFIFNMGRKPCLVTQEISAMIPHWKGNDSLVRILKIKSVLSYYKLITCTKDTYPILFEECARLGVDKIYDDSGNIVKELHFFEIDDVIHMLKNYLSGSEEIIQSLIRESENERLTT